MKSTSCDLDSKSETSKNKEEGKEGENIERSSSKDWVEAGRERRRKRRRKH